MIRYYYGWFGEFNKLGCKSEFLFYLFLKERFRSGNFFSSDITKSITSYGISVQRAHKLLTKCHEIGLLTKIKLSGHNKFRYDLTTYKKLLDFLPKKVHNREQGNRFRYCYLPLDKSITESPKKFKTYIQCVEIQRHLDNQEYKLLRQKIGKLKWYIGRYVSAKSQKARALMNKSIQSLVEWFKKASVKQGQSLNLFYQMSCSKIASVLGYSGETSASNFKFQACQYGFMHRISGRKSFVTKSIEAVNKWQNKFFFNSKSKRYYHVDCDKLRILSSVCPVFSQGHTKKKNLEYLSEIGKFFDRQDVRLILSLEGEN